MQFEGGATVSFTMIAFTEKVCQRQVKIFGTKVFISDLHYLLTVFFSSLVYAGIISPECNIRLL